MSEQAATAYRGIALAAPVTVPYVRFSEHGAAWFIGQALGSMLKRATLKKSAVDGLAISSFTLAPDTAVALTEHFSMSPRWIEHLPMGGASGLIAMRRAARAVQCGDADIVACIAGDTSRPGGFRDLVANFSRFSREAVYPYAAPGPNGVFAMITRNYMERHGATREDFGRICIAQRENARQFQPALFRDPLTMDQYLEARPIAEPLHLYDCVMPCAGGEGFLVMGVERAASLGLPYATIESSIERHNAFFEDDIATRGGWELDRDTLYDAAGVGPTDMDFLETYDDYPVAVALQLEGLGFCERGCAPDFIRTTDLTVGGEGLPHNTSGGQLSVGQAGAAGGFLGLTEAIRQLTGASLGGAVAHAMRGLVSGYGMVNYDRCLCAAAAILGRGSS